MAVGVGVDEDGRLTRTGLTLHGVRVLGAPAAREVASLYGAEDLEDLDDLEDVQELLLDLQACGWVTRHEAGPRPVWSVTDRGRDQGERWLARDLDARGARAAVAAAHDRFGPLNTRLLSACTRWQVRPTSWDPMAENDHTDYAWDDRIIDELDGIGRNLNRLTESVVGVLPRFGAHAPRFAAALEGVHDGSLGWVDSPHWPSCHIVWIQLHEDLLATLGLSRG